MLMLRILFACILTLIPAANLLAGPAIEIPGSTFDFGRVRQHTVVSHTFWIKSVGDDTLRITKVVPGCGCTKAPLQDSVLAPGDSTRLDLFFSTRSFRGYVTKRPFLETNIGEDKTYLKIYALLQPEPDKDTLLVLSPDPLDVSQFTDIPRRKGKFLIENRSNRDFKLTLVDWARDYFDVDLPGEVKAGETVEGKIVIHKDKIPEEFEHSLTFKLNNDEETRYTLPIKRVVRIKKKIK